MSCEPWPTAITLDQASRTVELVWDGEPAALTHAALRAACRCSHCESVRRACGAAPPLAPGFFSDGHDRGIYPWPYLYELAYERPMS
jgi:DUF971 family protein